MIGGSIGLAFGIVPLIRGVREAASASDPETQARVIEDRVLTRNPPLALVARREPELWADAHRKLIALLHDHPDGLGNAEVAEFMAPLNDRIGQAAVQASDPKVVAIYSSRLGVLQKLQAANPEACKSFVARDFQALSLMPNDLKDIVRSADQPLYDAYEDGVGKPAPTLLTAAQADATLTRLQDQTGIRMSSKDAAALGGNEPAADVCDATVRFTKMLVTSPAAESAPVIRFLLLH